MCAFKVGSLVCVGLLMVSVNRRKSVRRGRHAGLTAALRSRSKVPLDVNPSCSASTKIGTALPSELDSATATSSTEQSAIKTGGGIILPTGASFALLCAALSCPNQWTFAGLETARRSTSLCLELARSESAGKKYRCRRSAYSVQLLTHAFNSFSLLQLPICVASARATLKTSGFQTALGPLSFAMALSTSLLTASRTRGTGGNAVACCAPGAPPAVNGASRCGAPRFSVGSCAPILGVFWRPGLAELLTSLGSVLGRSCMCLNSPRVITFFEAAGLRQPGGLVMVLLSLSRGEAPCATGNWVADFSSPLESFHVKFRHGLALRGSSFAG
mmetsp:Transcript_75954/g.180618  ORF Transcript_75954/g.180618 Transcript_75954/m.180618 type:complete len:330 (+) Transcript_75954:1949-2938(+)